MARVLVTGVGGVGGASTVRWLRDRTSHDPVGVDMDPRARGFLELDEWETVPPADDDDWPSEVARVVARHDVEAVIPLVDEELARLPDLRAVLPTSIPIVAPTGQTIERTLDKRRFARWIGETDLPAPTSVCPTDETALTDPETGFPAVVKPRLGHGSRGVERVDSSDELRAYFERYEFDPTDVVLQESIDGREFTTSVVASQDGECLAIVPKAVLEKAGNTTWGVTRPSEAVSRTCRRVHDALDPRGPINVQQLLDPATGEATIVEINPRFSSTACLTASAGVDEFDLLVRDALGESVRAPRSFTAGIHLIRASADHVLTDEEVHERSFPDVKSAASVPSAAEYPVDATPSLDRRPSPSDTDPG